MSRRPLHPEAGGEVAEVMLRLEVVRFLRLDEEVGKDGTVRKRPMPNAMRSLDYLARTGRLMPIPGCGKSGRYAKSAVLKYANGESIGSKDRR